MAGDLTTIIEAIEDRLKVLGYNPVKAVFDFNAVPDSTIDKSYRIETKLVGNEYATGQTALTTEAIEIYVAYKLGRAHKDAWADALDDRETIEKDIINDATIAALAQDPILKLDREASVQKYIDNYLISKIVFSCDYIRELED